MVVHIVPTGMADHEQHQLLRLPILIHAPVREACVDRLLGPELFHNGQGIPLQAQCVRIDLANEHRIPRRTQTPLRVLVQREKLRLFVGVLLEGIKEYGKDVDHQVEPAVLAITQVFYTKPAVSINSDINQIDQHTCCVNFLFC